MNEYRKTLPTVNFYAMRPLYDNVKENGGGGLMMLLDLSGKIEVHEVTFLPVVEKYQSR